MAIDIAILIFKVQWNKYGESNFTFEVIEECTVEEIDNRETYWIDLYKSIDPNFGYNLTAGGQGIHGYAWSNEKKLFLSKLRNPSTCFTVEFIR